MRKTRVQVLVSALAAMLMAATLSSVTAAGAEITDDSRDGAGEALAVNETVGQIERAYKTLLGRDPDDGGLNYWLEQQAAGLSIEDIIFLFLASPERVAKYPADQSNDEFLVQLYSDAFGREPDAGGRDYWVAQLDAGLSRNDVARLFINSQEQQNATGPNPVFDLNIFHMNDHHSNLLEDDISIEVGGVEFELPLGGFPRVVAQYDALEAAHAGENNLKLHAGDAITGTRFFSLFDGEADAALMNEVCFDAFTVGNHEFDAGDAGLVTFLDFLNANPSVCETPVLGANIVPAAGTPLNPTDGDPYLQPFVIKEFGGEQVGIIGIDIAQKTQVSSSPLETTQFLDEVETVQANVDALEDLGVNKIIVLSHYTYANDLALAAAVSGVDVIVGGDSHSPLGEFGILPISSQGAYPTEVVDPSGLPVCVVQAWQFSNIVGDLAVSFDPYGHVASCDGTPNVLLGTTATKEVNDEDVAATAEELAAITAALEGTPGVQIDPDADATTILDGFSAQVEIEEMTVIGTVTEDLCIGRIPNDGRSGLQSCIDNGTPNGGDIQQLVAYAFADRAFDADFALQNSGGVRIDIPAGDLTIGDAYNLLPFANTMVNMEMTGAEVKQALEDAIANIVDEGGSSGAYPYGAYLRWDVDFTAAAGERVSNLEIRAKADGSTYGPIDPAATYTVVVNSFIAGGRDGYLTLGTVSEDGRATDTFIDYAQGFIDYVEQDLGGVVSKVPAEDYSTQNFTPLG